MSVSGLGDVHADGIYSVTGDFPDQDFGFSVAGVDDVTRDGVPDFLIGAPMASPGGRKGAGAMYLYSGESGSLVQKLEGRQAGDELGHAVARAGDTNGSQVPDFLGGARFSGSGTTNNLGAYLLAEFDGYLTSSQNTLSRQTGGVAVLQIDFPQSESGLPYGVLMSSSGGEFGLIQGVGVNLTQD